MSKDSWKPRGLLQFADSAAKFQLTRHPPAPLLGNFVERYWIIQ